MKHLLKEKVYYADTDSYGVVWHGTYLRWMEAGRVEFCRELGLDLTVLKKQDIVLPVTNINLRYKASAKLEDDVIVETQLSKMTPLTVIFKQIIKDKNSEKTFVVAEVEVVAVNSEGRIYRRLPDALKSACEKALEQG